MLSARLITPPLTKRLWQQVFVPNKKSRFQLAALLQTKQPRAVESAHGLVFVNLGGLVDRLSLTIVVIIVITPEAHLSWERSH